MSPLEGLLSLVLSMSKNDGIFWGRPFRGAKGLTEANLDKMTQAGWTGRAYDVLPPLSGPA